MNANVPTPVPVNVPATVNAPVNAPVYVNVTVNAPVPVPVNAHANANANAPDCRTPSPSSLVSHPHDGGPMKTGILLDHERAPEGNAHVVRALLRIEGEAPVAAERVPLNLALVLDRSGSMNGAPLEQAKAAAALLVRRLWPEDVVSVVAYDDVVETIAEPATGAAQAQLARQIEAIDARGCTNLSGGWLRGRELVARGRREGGANRVLLLTDGLANVGITEPERLVGLCRSALDQGITTTTIGFGQGYDEELLREMAEAGGGSTYYIESPDQAPAVFTEEIEGLLSLCAQNVTVELRPARAARLVLVHHAYPRHAIEGGVRLELGDLYARDPRLVLAEFLVPTGDPAEDADVAELTVTADVLTSTGIERQEIHLPIRASLAAGPHVEPEVRRELLLLEAAKAREEARKAQQQGDLDGAARSLHEVAECIMPYADDDACLAEELLDLRLMEDRFGAGAADAADAKYLRQRSYAAATSRPGNLRSISRVRPHGGLPLPAPTEPLIAPGPDTPAPDTP